MSSKGKSDRRLFIKNLGLGGITAGLMPAAVITQEQGRATSKPGSSQQATRTYNDVYQGAHLNYVAYPIGGLGAGMFCMEGTGTISHMSVRNKPDIYNEPGMFAAISVKGVANGAKILEGPVADWRKFGRPGSGNGSGGSITGLPHFHHAAFKARFPLGEIELRDDDIPLQVWVTGWSPFIPIEEDNSSLPVGAIEYRMVNTSPSRVEGVFSYHARNFLRIENGVNSIDRLANGFILHEYGTREKPSMKGQFAIFTHDAAAVVDYCWFRGGWWDPLTMAWNAIKQGEVKSVEPVESGAPGASLFIPFTLDPNEEKTMRVMMAWYTPETELTYGKTDDQAGVKCDPSTGCCQTASDLGGVRYNDFETVHYKPWYAGRFSDVESICKYWIDNYDDLKKRSILFRDAFYNSTLPPEVLEAVAANLTILKSPTVLRQHDGRLWNFEGCGDSSGCCHGSCTHVWNYAQAIPHLFPALERTLRHTEFCEDQNAEGHQTFRAALPIRPVDHGFYSAADGQLGGIMKVYRDWRISGDDEWLRRLFPMVRVSMDYCIRTWDPRHKGVVEEPHHNTYDIEFWGPDPMCTSFYLGALDAFAIMGSHLREDVSLYRQLAGSGRSYMTSSLFNGEYYFQEVKFSGLNAPNPIDASLKSIGGNYSDEARALLEKEGPKYQYGSGCLSDGVLGAWIARMCGLGDPLDSAKVTSHLLSVHKYNLKHDLSDHANPQRPAYALGDEGGLLLCTWPKGGKPALPFVYSDEVWTGIEYQVASHLILMGQVDEGLEIVRTCRDRYDGRVRNPFNEYECGHWYARALASYGLLQGLTGVRYDAVDKTLHVDSRIGDFTSFLSTATGFGNVTLADNRVTLHVVYGDIDARKALVSGKSAPLDTSKS